MANLVRKSFDNPDDSVTPDKTSVATLEFGSSKSK